MHIWFKLLSPEPPGQEHDEQDAPLAFPDAERVQAGEGSQIAPGDGGVNQASGQAVDTQPKARFLEAPPEIETLALAAGDAAPRSAEATHKVSEGGAPTSEDAASSVLVEPEAGTVGRQPELINSVEQLEGATSNSAPHGVLCSAGSNLAMTEDESNGADGADTRTSLQLSTGSSTETLPKHLEGPQPESHSAEQGRPTSMLQSREAAIDGQQRDPVMPSTWAEDRTPRDPRHLRDLSVASDHTVTHTTGEETATMISNSI